MARAAARAWLVLLPGLLALAGCAVADPAAGRGEAAPAPAATCAFYQGQVVVRAAPAGAWQWHPLPLGGGGFNIGVLFDPRSADRLYLAVDVAGVFRSDDGGRRWTGINEGMHGLAAGRYAIGGLALDPQRPDTLYASLGWAGAGRNGILRSDDGGLHWRFLSDAVAAHGEGPLARKAGQAGLLVHPRDGSRLYCADNQHEDGAGGVWLSRDAGATWAPSGLTGRRVLDLRFAPGDPEILYAAAIAHRGRPGGLSVSRDGGATWASAGLDGRDVHALAIDAGDARRLYAACGTAGVWRSADGGATWEDASATLPLDAKGDRDRFYTFTYKAIDADPRLPGHLFAAAEAVQGLFESHDGGTTWARRRPQGLTVPAGSLVHEHHFAWHTSQIRFSPHDSRTLVLQDFFATWISRDGGATWATAPFGQETSCFTGLVADRQVPGRVYAGVWDHVLAGIDDDPLAPRRLDLGTPPTGFNRNLSALVRDAARPERFLAVSCASVLSWSADAGRTWTRSTEGLPAAAEGRLGKPLVAGGRWYLPVNGARAEGGGILASDDGGRSWQAAAGAGLPALRMAARYWYPQGVFAAADNGSLLALVSDGALWVSRDRASTWCRLEVPSAASAVLVLADGALLVAGADGLWRGGEDGWRRSGDQERGLVLAQDPHHPARLLCYGESIPAAGQALRMDLRLSEDGGASWHALMNPSLSIQRLHDVAFDPWDRGRVYATTYWGGLWVAARP